MIYAQEVRPQIVEENPGASFAEIGRMYVYIRSLYVLIICTYACSQTEWATNGKRSQPQKKRYVTQTLPVC